MRIFDFGSNWQAFSEQHVDAQRLTVAARSIQALLRRETLSGISVLDVGCGSGLFSIAAYQLGAAKVVGIDINPRCIAVSKRNRDCLAPKTSISFQQSSVLDVGDLESFGTFDLVYAWGSLHHTGAMWDAIRNVTRCVAPGGTLVLAIYNKHVTSPIWKWIKWFYNQLPGVCKQLMIFLFAGIIYVTKFLVTLRNPLDKERGMNFWYDVVDWIGGYPYEYALPANIEAFVCDLGFMLHHRVDAQVPTGCNEFVFMRTTVEGKTV